MKFIADLHVHTVASGHAYSTIEEYVARARKAGLKMIAIADHGPAMPGAPHFYHFSNFRMLPRKINGIRILRSAEANIVNDLGEIDLKEDIYQWGEMDFLLATFHPNCGYEEKGEAGNTEVLIRALNNPRIKIIAHPENPRYPVSVKETVAAAKEKGVLIEINNSSGISRPGSFDRTVEFAKEVKRAGWKAVVGTDSHISTMLGDYRYALRIIKAAGLREKDIVNTSEKMLRDYLHI
jgi:putative hydrolase